MIAYLALRWRLDDADAEDAVQGFLATAWGQDTLSAYDASKARFRTFLRVLLDRHLQHQWRAERAAKRGGGVPLEPMTDLAGQDPDGLFQREWIRALFDRTVVRLRAELIARNRAPVFAVFDRYDLGPDDDASYADLARDLGLTVTQVTNYLHAARRRFREMVLDDLRDLATSEDEYRALVRETLGP